MRFAKLRLPRRTRSRQGASVLVAVVDTPIDAAHPDLADVVVSSFDATGAAGQAACATGPGIARRHRGARQADRCGTGRETARRPRVRLGAAPTAPA
jgi:hypothetical protein